MLAIYNTATVCDQEDPLKCGLRLEGKNIYLPTYNLRQM